MEETWYERERDDGGLKELRYELAGRVAIAVRGAVDRDACRSACREGVDKTDGTGRDGERFIREESDAWRLESDAVRPESADEPRESAAGPPVDRSSWRPP